MSADRPRFGYEFAERQMFSAFKGAVFNLVPVLKTGLWFRSFRSPRGFYMIMD